MIPSPMRVQVKIYAWFSGALVPDYRGTLVLEEALPPEASLRTCLTGLAARYTRFAEVIYDPEANALHAQVIVSHNGRVISGTGVLELVLHEGDTVALIPAYAGGLT